MKAQIHVSSNQRMQESTKMMNAPTSSTHIVIKIIKYIYLEVSMSYQQLKYSMVPSLTGVPIKNIISLEAVPTQKQEQCTQEC